MKKIYIFLLLVIIVSVCPKHQLAASGGVDLINNNVLFPVAFAQYDEFISENTVISETADAQMIIRTGNRLAEAAKKLLEAEGKSDKLKNYEWEFTLVSDNAVNAWALPGGKIVFNTGILPVAESENGIAVVMGHEIAHAILDHGLKRLGADALRQIGALGVAVLTDNSEIRSLLMIAYGIGSNVAGILPYSREQEKEADEYGLLLMAIAGYNPDEGTAFWERMSAAGDGRNIPQFLSTHPSDKNRITNLKKYSSEAKKKAATFLKQ